MKALDLATYIRTKTRTNTTTFTDAEMLPFVKFRQDEIARTIQNSLAEDEDIFLTPHIANLIASSTQRDYGFEGDMLSRLKRVEAMFDGVNWVRLHGMDMNEYKGTHDEDSIIANFNNYQYQKASNPGGASYDIQRRSIFIYSGTIEPVTNGLKVWFFDYPAYITDLTENTLEIEDDPSNTTHGFPRELHEILARGVIIDWKDSQEKPIPLTEKELRYEYDMNKAILTLKHADQSRELIGQLPPASERGNDGADY